MNTGKIKYISPQGFGFIEIEGRLDKEGKQLDLFFHARHVVGVEFTSLLITDKVSFDIDVNEKGDVGVNVKLLNN